LENVQFTTLAEATVSLTASSLQQEAFDLIVIPRAFASDPLFPSDLLPQLWDLTDHRLALIDAGLIYTAFEDRVIGVELPWEPNFILAIATATAQFERAFSFLSAIGQNILIFTISGQTISVKALLLENKHGELAFDLHLEFDKPPEAADASDRQDWSCRIAGKAVVCETKFDSLPQGGRLAVGVAFIEDVGQVQDCWWSREDGTKIGGC